MPKTAGLDQETDYEKVRQQNMLSNQKLLEELMGKQMDLPAGLAAGFAVLGIQEPKPKAKKAAKPKVTKPKVVKEEEVDREDRGTRRSARQASKPVVSYAKDGEKIVDKSKMPKMVSRPDKNWDGDDTDEGEGQDGEGKVRVNKLVGRVHDPKTFGLIPGVPIGSWWETRAECSAAAIHAPFVAGISGGPEGAYSVALSGGYDDDIDMGDAFTYTGSGGRDLKGTAKNPKNLRTAPQSSHQSFEHSFNKALKISSETRKPVRVIRGYKLTSIYAPEEGYRYDGLYIVERAWMDRGNNPKGWKVCKFAFRRIPGQPPIPKQGEKPKVSKEDVEMKDAEDEDDEEDEEEDAVEEGEEEEDEGEEQEKSEAEEEQDDVEEEEPKEEPKEKPKRGRKPGRKSQAKVAPKEEPEDEDELEEEEEKPAPAKRGRKPKPKVEEEPQEKPKRGRKPGPKPKAKVEEEEPEEEESKEEEEPVEKPKRGRKPGPKPKAQSEPESEPAPKRGRKPKAQSEPEPEEEEEGTPPAKKSKVEEPPKKRGRGRPPKKQQ